MDISFQVSILLLVFIIINIFYRGYDKNKYVAVISNVRPVRAFVFMLAVLIGVAVSALAENLISYSKVFAAVISVFFVWEFSVVINDIYDEDIDKITNTNRPLSQGILNVKEYKWVAGICVFFVLAFALIINLSVFFISVIWVVLGVIYSVPPL